LHTHGSIIPLNWHGFGLAARSRVSQLFLREAGIAVGHAVRESEDFMRFEFGFILFAND
jgi:hypothetical protein